MTDMELSLANPALCVMIENALLSPGQITVAGGVGLGEGTLDLPEGIEAQRFLMWMRNLRERGIMHWRDWDTRHIHRAAAERQIGVIDVLGALSPVAETIDQPILDWLTLRSEPDARLDSLLGGSEMEDMLAYSEDDMHLAYAFRDQMVQEAAPVQHQAATGLYLMKRPDLPRLDREIRYDHMRLYVHARGIVASMVTAEHWYFPFAWGPDGTNTSSIFVHPRAIFALDVTMACIWRDACVITERWATRGHKAKLGGQAPKASKERRVVLPRVVYRSEWGTDASEREAIRQITRQAHAVRACYPRLPEGWQAREATERAGTYGYPPPPDGHTFRAPHTRGEGAVQADAPVVYCRGLQVAKILLS